MTDSQVSRRDIVERGDGRAVQGGVGRVESASPSEAAPSTTTCRSETPPQHGPTMMDMVCRRWCSTTLGRSRAQDLPNASCSATECQSVALADDDARLRRKASILLAMIVSALAIT